MGNVKGFDIFFILRHNRRMQKLILASDGSFLFDKGYDLTGIPKGQIRVAYVITASKGVKNRRYIDAHEARMREKGLAFEEIDIEGKSKEELLRLIEDKNIIHMEGGNTFYLLKAVKETGFDQIIKDAIARGVVYMGTSAGSYIACPSIEVSAWGPVVKDKYGLTDFIGLGLVPFLLKAHYKDEFADLMREKSKTASAPLRILRDGQAIFVQDGKYTFVGVGEETKLN